MKDARYPELGATLPEPTDFNEAQRFLTLLDEESANWTFQTFDDSKRKDRTLARIFHGSLDTHAHALAELNARGAGIFVTVAETDGRGRKEANIKRIRAVFVDLDGSPLEPVLSGSLLPHITVESSPQRFHAYWLVSDCPLDQFKPIQKALATRFKGDKAVHDLPRVMRLPGFWHCKGDPYRTRILDEDLRDEDLRPAYTLAEIKAAFEITDASQQETQERPADEEGDWRATIVRIVATAAERTHRHPEKGRNAQALWIGYELRREGIPSKAIPYAAKTYCRLMRKTDSDGKENEYSEERAVETIGNAYKEGAGVNGGQGLDEEEPGANIVVIDLAEFLAQELPLRQNLLAPWLPRQGLAMLYAPRGVGKTHVSLGIAYAVVCGSQFLGWEAPEPGGVLFLDGEMPAADLQGRLARIALSEDKEPAAPLRIMTPDLQPLGMPDLASDAGQVAINRYVTDDISLLIVDNLSTLARGIKENEGDSWLAIQSWALMHRAKGRSVLFIHHAGKGGSQRGTSRREDVLDTVIALRRPADYRPEDGAVFEVHFEKARGICGQDVPLRRT